MTDIEGAILAGGLSRRMGSDKSALILGDSSVLERVAAAMEPLPGMDRIRVIGERVADAKGYPVQADLKPGLGPLSGIHAALATAEAGAVLVVACDLPFVTVGLLAGLCERLGPGIDAVVPRLSGRAVPVCAVYRDSCVEPLSGRLERGELKAQEFVASLATAYVDDDVLAELDPRGVCLRNINTPEDLEEARAILAELT